jgi:hypothetical protein
MEEGDKGMRKIMIGIFSVLTAILLTLSTSVNVAARDDIKLGELETIVNQVPDCEAYAYPNGSLSQDPWNPTLYYLNHTCPGDGDIRFYVDYDYIDNHISGSFPTGEHTFHIDAEHYSGDPPTLHCSEEDEDVIFTGPSDSGDGTIEVFFDHLLAGDKVQITIGCTAKDLSDPPDVASDEFKVIVTLT